MGSLGQGWGCLPRGMSRPRPRGCPGPGPGGPGPGGARPGMGWGPGPGPGPGPGELCVSQHALRQTPPAHGYCCGRYASYWNGFLLSIVSNEEIGIADSAPYRVQSGPGPPSSLFVTRSRNRDRRDSGSAR